MSKAQAEMTTHPDKKTGASQCDKILAALQSQSGRWVSMPLLSRLSDSLNVHSRISDLRKKGHQIEQATEITTAGKRSYYSLIE